MTRELVPGQQRVFFKSVRSALVAKSKIENEHSIRNEKLTSPSLVTNRQTPMGADASRNLKEKLMNFAQTGVAVALYLTEK